MYDEVDGPRLCCSTPWSRGSHFYLLCQLHPAHNIDMHVHAEHLEWNNYGIIFFHTRPHPRVNGLSQKSSRYGNFKYKTGLEGFGIDCWRNPSWVKVKFHTMALDHIQSSGVFHAGIHEVFLDDKKLRKLCQEGRLKEALQMVEVMVRRTNEVPTSAFVCLLKGCIKRKALAEGKQVHAFIVQSKCDLNIPLGNNLVNMYYKCGSLLDAQKVFEAMPQKDLLTWTALISAFTNAGKYEVAIQLFHQMQENGIAPDKVAFVIILKACARISALEPGKQLHLNLRERGLESDVIIQSTLVDMYAKCGQLHYARKLFDDMRERDSVSWTVIIGGYVQNGLGKEALSLYEQMKQEHMQPDIFTFILVSKACASIAALEQGKQLHSDILNRGLESNIVVQSTLVDMYAKCGCLEESRKVFDSMSERDVVSWTGMMGGYVENGLGKEALALYERMKQEGVQPDVFTFVVLLKACASIRALEQGKQFHLEIRKRGLESNLILQSTLVDMYAKCARFDDARELFDNMRYGDVVSWTVMIGGYAEHGHGKEALALYEQMKQRGVHPNKVTFVVALKACASIAALEQGKGLHSDIRKKGFESDVIIRNTLIDMYAKCGCLEDSWELFKNMRKRDLVSWNVMIGGYGQNGLGKKAIALYQRMKQGGVQPDAVTFVSVLSACSRSGLVDEGRHIFDYMVRCHGIRPTVEHYACMVDLLGRAACLAEAEDLVIKSPIQRDPVVWMSLLGAARNHGHVEIGRRAFDCVVKLEPENVASYLLIIDIYAAAGKMVEVTNLRKEMKHKGLKEVPDCSWIEVGGQVHAFHVGDANHPQHEQIQTEFHRLMGLMKKAGYEPDLSSVLDELEEEEKEIVLCKHSEKLALTFGLMNLPSGEPIRIKKNLCMCHDCHNATKIISKIVGREICVVDASQFHHFKDGICSCQDYW